MDRPESLDGVVHEEPEQAFVYRRAHALLNQPADRRRAQGGVRYRPDGVTPGCPKVLHALHEAGIAGRDGVVYCPRTRTAVLETVRCWLTPATAHPLLHSPRFPRAVKLPGMSLSLATLDGEGFYHFLAESLPKLWLARDIIPAIDHVLVSGARQPIIEQWLRCAGIAEQQICWLTPLTHYRCEQLLFSAPPIAESQPTPWLREALHALLGVERQPAGRRWLWISRADATSRHLTWEDRLLERFPKFEKLSLTRLAPREQQAAFAAAAVVAGPHGAGLTNTIFAPAGVRLVEFFPDDQYQPLFARFAQVAGGTAAWATVDFARATDLDRLETAIAGFLATTTSATAPAGTKCT